MSTPETEPPTRFMGWKSALALISSGTVAAQLVAFVVAIAIARQYSPTELGVFALVIAAASTLVPISVASIPSAIVPAQTDEDALGLVRAALLLLVLITPVITACTIVFVLLRMSETGAIGPELVFLGPVVLLQGIFTVLQQVALRRQEYPVIVRRTLLQVVATGVGQVGLGAVAPSAWSLLVGDLTGRAVGISGLVSSYRRLCRAAVGHLPSRRSLWSTYGGVVRRYLPAILLDTLALQSVILAVGYLFGAEAAGFVGLAQRVVLLPVTVIGVAAGQVVLSKSAATLRSGEGLSRQGFSRAVLGLGAVGVLVTVGIILVAPTLFPRVFGPDWATAGTFAQLMAVQAGLGIVWTPISQLFLNFRAFGLFLWVSLCRATLVIIVGSLTFLVGGNAFWVVGMMSLTTAAVQAVGVLLAKRLVR